MHEIDGLVQDIGQLAQNVVKHDVDETVIATSSEVDIGRI